MDFSPLNVSLGKWKISRGKMSSFTISPVPWWTLVAVVIAALLSSRETFCTAFEDRHKLYGPKIPDAFGWPSWPGHSFGDWHPEKDCPPGTFVLGARLKIEGRQGVLGDDTALNGIEFYCAKPWTTALTNISSGEAEWGQWKAAIFCPAFQFAVGFEIKVDPTVPGKDNVGAVNLALLCSRDLKEGGPAEGGWTWEEVKWLEGQGVEGGDSWGNWMGEQKCESDSALCSIQTFVQAPQGSASARDDSGLVTMASSCCRIQ